MITVAVLEVWNPVENRLEPLFFTSGSHYVTQHPNYPGTHQCLPLIEGDFTFTQTLVKGSLAESSVQLDYGEISLVNLSGILDQYKGYGFDGRKIELYRVSTDPGTTLGTPSFVGRMGVPTFEWDQLTLPIQSRQLDLEVPVSEGVFADKVVDPITHSEGDGSWLGKTKPRAWGRCSNVSPALLNNFKLLYGVNFDRDGNRAPVSNIFAVYSKGGLYTFRQDWSDLASLMAATNINAGYYDTCIAEGVFRLGSVPSGEVTADILQGTGLISDILASLFTDVGFVPLVDYGPLPTSPLPLGYYMDADESVLDVMTLMLQSVGYYAVPDMLGMYKFGRLDGTPGTPGTTVLNYDIVLQGTIKSLPGFTKTGVPAKGVTFNHTPYFTQLPESSALPSLDAARLTRLADKWETVYREGPPVVTNTHLMAQDEEVFSYVNVESPWKFQDLEFYGTPYVGWWVQAGGITTGFTEGVGYVLSGNGRSLTQTITVPTAIAAQVELSLTYSKSTGVSTWNLTGTGSALSLSNGTNVKVSMTRDTTTATAAIQVVNTSGNVTLHKFEITVPAWQQALDQEMTRRTAILTAPQEVYSMTVPLDLASSMLCGDAVTFQVPRYGLDTGRDFTIVSREEDWQSEEVTLTIWRSENAS